MRVLTVSLQRVVTRPKRRLGGPHLVPQAPKSAHAAARRLSDPPQRVCGVIGPRAQVETMAYQHWIGRMRAHGGGATAPPRPCTAHGMPASRHLVTTQGAAEPSAKRRCKIPSSAAPLCPVPDAPSGARRTPASIVAPAARQHGRSNAVAVGLLDDTRCSGAVSQAKMQDPLVGSPPLPRPRCTFRRTPDASKHRGAGRAPARALKRGCGWSPPCRRGESRTCRRSPRRRRPGTSASR